ncbi:hypothetical protein ABU162_05020 [Paenibacillus thiaminolyticus]|uniref:hypothetical protein n=1 Tax=Paenibacillus thiaminolyticus TaxID=49283 RepID=UPI0035A5DDAA
MTYRQIDENTEEGFQDLEFDIVESRFEEDRNHFLVFGQYHHEIVGFEVIVRNDMLPGIVQWHINEEAFYGTGITLKSIGPESDAFIRALLELYGYEGKLKCKDEIPLTCISLHGDPGNIKQEEVKFKVFYDDHSVQDLYCEFYINILVQDNILELKEKDTEYRENIVRALGK